MFKIKRRKSDILFRELLLKKRGEVCEHCGRRGRVEVSHFWGRANETVRFSEENCELLCTKCHQVFTANPHEHSEWVKKKLGEKRYKALMIEANRTGKRDDKLMEIVLKQELYGYREKSR